MNFWGHSFIGHGHGSPEMICKACGYVVERASTEDAMRFIHDREGCELHCGGDWHVFKRVDWNRELIDREPDHGQYSNPRR